MTSGNCRFALEKSSDDVDAATACLFLRNIFLKSHGMIWLPRLKEKVQTEREKETERDEERVSKGRGSERIAGPKEDEEIKRLTFISHDISHTHMHTHTHIHTLTLIEITHAPSYPVENVCATP